MLPVSPFKSALVEHLLRDYLCNELLGSRIYDDPPRDLRADESDLTASPWAYLGPVAAQRVESDCGPGWMLRLRLYVASTAAGRDEAWTAMDAIAAAIDGATLTMSAPFVQAQQAYVMLGGDVIDPISPKLVYIDISAVVAG